MQFPKSKVTEMSKFQQL